MHTKTKVLLIGLVLFCLGSPEVVHALKCPHVLFVLDASGSMDRTPDGNLAGGGNPSKWNIAKAALQDLLKTYNNKFPIGFNYFPNDGSACGVKSASDVDVQIRFNSEAQINALLSTLVAPNGATPTYTALTKARANEELQDPSRGEYIVLITDGGPCCSNPSSCGIAGLPDQTDLASTVQEIKLAHDSPAAIKTFVIGFGSLPAEAQAGMNQMADAGGVPAPQTGGNTDRYYKADSANALTQALSSIFQNISAGDAGMSQLCDDSCYAAKCPAGQGCTAGVCRTNPCNNFICPDGQYCYTDGSSAPTCKKVCDISCAAGQRCILGECFTTPCPLACGDRESCDPTGKCVSDTACSPVRCQPTQGCRNGRCFDDPCTYITCPQDFTCIPFEGTCAAGSDSTGTVRGCHCDLTGHGSLPSSIPALLGGLMAWLLMRRRRRLVA